ncbi:MAG TPA: bifunctional phosphoglucose/phosphomannose isomerase [Candidatus Saccharimonadales bacterium]|nr:bifunctional phosphoglucose/phosphomannose isomerase [Candidatus Saccharimonadales bacterium]
MLDDLKFIHFRDGQDALGIAEKQPAQLEYAFELPHISGEFSNVVYAGMGGSALAALLAATWPGYNLPFEVCRDYHLPAYVSRETLFIASSYSGNTEETLSALAEAEEKGAKVLVIAGGGKLVEIAKEKGHSLLLLPKADQPRYAVFYNLKALVAILEAAGLLNKNEATKELHQTATFLTEVVKTWLPTVPQKDNPAKKLAMELAGNSIVIYGGPLMAPAAYKWKISFNENAKNVAWWNQLSEFDHNELIGWSSHPIEKPYAIVELRSGLENPRILKRFEVAEKLLSGRRPAPYIVKPEGQTVLEQLLWAVCFGDFVSIYVALLNNQNPAPVDLVEKFKKQLDQ